MEKRIRIPQRRNIQRRATDEQKAKALNDLLEAVRTEAWCAGTCPSKLALQEALMAYARDTGTPWR